MTGCTILSNQWVRSSLALLGGAIGTLAYGPFNVWICAFLSFTSLLILLSNRTLKQSMVIGFLWGVGFYASGIHWIYYSIQHFGELPILVSLLLVALLACYLSLYSLLFALILNYLWPKNSLVKLAIAAPALWTILEFLRGTLFSGFPWLQLGYSQIDGPLKGIAPIAGVDAITLVIVFVSALFSYSYLTKRLRFSLLALLIIVIISPLQQIQWVKEQPGRMLNVALVQGNIAQSLKWSPDALYPTIDNYLKLSEPYFGTAQLIIWPEAAIPDIEQNQVVFLKQLDDLLRSQHSILLTGIIDHRATQQGSKTYNTLIALGSRNSYSLQNANRYHKQHLVIFGEYVPFETLLRPLAGLFDLPMSSMTEGEANQPRIRTDGYIFTTAICYEVILGTLVRQNFNGDSDFLITVSNDAWFGDSIGPWQHFDMARMRALELGRPMLRATNNGITSAIAANGQIIKKLPQFETAVLNVKMTPTTGMTPYAQWGSYPTWLVTLLMTITGLALRFIRAN